MSRESDEGTRERFAPPAISLPTGGGAIRGIDERFSANPATGTGTTSVGVAVSPGRSGFGPALALAYDSGAGDGAFGRGWELGLPAIARRTDNGLPRYHGEDVFVLAGGEDLVPMPGADPEPVGGYTIERFQPRIEADFARIERWTRTSDGDVHWRTLSPDNLLTIYGRDGESRIADPRDPRRVFSWLICETRDDRGNAILYRYVAEDAAGVDVTEPHERGREAADRSGGRYLKRVLYGNREPLLDAQGRRPVDLTPEQREDAHWHFELVLDYGEHDAENPLPGDNGTWACRQDPFSTCRPGFEVRTYRLCRRLLMFHHFPDEADVGENCLVNSTDLEYRADPAASLLASVTQRGYMRDGAGGYTSAALPAVTFSYSEAVIDEHVREVDAENLPAGLASPEHHWVDLDGEGLAGVLAWHSDAWWYKRNLGSGTLGPLERVGAVPSLARAGQQLSDLDGDGRLDLVQLDREPAGYFERSPEDGWDRFVAFASRPNVDWGDPNVAPIDLTGDGHADLLLAGDEVITWYPSLGADGFAPAERVAAALDEEHGPRLLLADGTQTIFLADMSGDGLTDIVRIRHSDVSYWPNLGYGRFGARVTMTAAPVIDAPDRFDPRRIRLADVDGSGPIDVLYVAADAVRVWFNQSGNRFSPPTALPALPHLDDLAAVRVADLLGNGTACLVWSSPLAGDAERPLRFVDLMGGTKPYLLVAADNGLGAETRVHYAPSTTFFLADRAAGRPWITRLPFPVQVVERVEYRDRVARSRLVSRFAYHHGYYDGVEREFRGFAMTEQHDSEAFVDYVRGVVDEGATAHDTAPELFQPPVTTRSWFHTGAYVGGHSAAHPLAGEYYGGGASLPEILLPSGLDERELRDCARALKGLPLRQEVYSFDGSSQQEHPYAVTERRYEVEALQPRVFAVHERETVTLHYERDPADPRVAHALNLELGPYGTVLLSASVAYGRRDADTSLPAEVTAAQGRTLVTCTQTAYTPDIDRTAPVPAYRLRAPHETRRFELTGAQPAAELFTADELLTAFTAAAPLDYEQDASASAPQKRLLEHTRRRFRADDLTALGQGQWDTLGLPWEDYALALTPGVTAAHYAGRLVDADYAAAGYVHLDGDANWWIPTGREVYPADPAAHFFLPAGARDALGLETRVTLDEYDLLPLRVQVVGAAWTTTEATNDYRVLAPVGLTDPNGNRTAVRLDALGMVVASAAMGKGEGDTLDDPTVRVDYDLFAWRDRGEPAVVRVRAREQHGAGNPRWHERFVYSNGGGGVAMVKRPAPPGPALTVGADGTITEVDADPRWIGNGRTVLNNKGSVVKAYEPYFSTTEAYESDEALRTIGATPLLFYDALGRNLRTEQPDGTLTRVEFDPWSERAFDANDTVLESRWYADRGSPDPATEPEPTADPERRAAWLAAKHADTPSELQRDSLGRVALTVAAIGAGVTRAQRSEADLTARRTKVFDERDREVASGFGSMTGVALYAESAERGGRWMFHDVLGRLVRTWDEHGRAFRMAYDGLHRPLALHVEEAGGSETALSYVVYGDRHPDAAARNLCGVPHQIFDQAGLGQIDRLDLDGSPTEALRVLARAYDAPLDWTVLVSQPDYAALQAAAAPLLETESFAAGATYDALKRPVTSTLHGGTVIRPSYDEAGHLAALSVQVEGQGPFVDVLAEQSRDARGRRDRVRLGNGVVTQYFYDPHSFRLTRLLTGASLQDLRYTYDPVGNVTQVRDGAQQTHFFANAVVSAESRFEFDALYQLVTATGREHAAPGNDAIRDSQDLAVVGQLPHLNDATAVRTYTERYEYDELGNLRRLRHVAPVATGSWTRHYRYTYDAVTGDATNRLAATSRPGDPESGPYTATYDHDAYGNFTRLNSTTPGELAWTALDQLRRVDLGGGGTAFYAYGVTGQRVRKVIERPGTLRAERIYLGPLEIFRERLGTGAPHLERRTIHIADDAGRIAQIDVKTIDDNGTDPANPLDVPLYRYVYGNNLGSAVLETDEAGTPISYEEYHPFGTTAYRSARPSRDISLKRYRYAGCERDDETGLYHMGARYYAPWLGRWTSADPAGFTAGLNLYRYCRNSPVVFTDPGGMQEQTYTTYSTDKLGLAGVTDPAEFSRRLRGKGFDFTGFDSSGNPAPPDAQGRGTGLARQTGAGWDVGAWLTRPPEGDGDGGSAGAGGEGDEAVEEVVVTPGNGSETAPPGGGDDESTSTTVGIPGGAASQTAPGTERFIWEYEFPGSGARGTQRGRILEWMLGVPWRDNTAGIDKVTATAVQQIKSTDVYDKIGNLTRSATRDAANHIAANPTTTTGRRPQAVIITPTDAPASAATAVDTALNPGRGRKIPANALPPEHVRGLPGRWGQVGRVLTGAGAVLSAGAFVYNVAQGDYGMAAGDLLSTVGGGLELYALATPGATVVGVSAMSAGLVLGGVGIAVGSGISAYRAYQRGDTPGVVAGVIGVAAGAAIVAGVILGAPLLLAAGLVAAAGVGLFHLYRWLSN